MRAVYLFKRDLRYEDNLGLSYVSRRHREIVPIFIFDKRIIKDLKAEGKRLYYVLKAVRLLSKKIKLYTFHCSTEDALREVFRVAKPTHLYTTSSYSWSGIERNRVIKGVCREYGVEYIEVFENFLVPPENISKRRVFSHFYNEWLSKLFLEEARINNFTVPDLPLPTLEDIKKQLKTEEFYLFNPEDCETRLQTFPFEKYMELRNYPGLDGSSKLSPCIRFGIISLRRILKATEYRSEKFLRELAWREFWYHIAIHFPETKSLEFQEKRRNISWENNDEFIEAFKEGMTGYPLVDAGIRQLKEEKWVHNRIRMILANFLTKVLLVDWRIGEEFFKEHLLDYDEVVNIGNWQWCASVGVDPKPFRLFNPILQAKKFDPECSYIKKYLPELSQIPCHMLHDPLRFRIPYHEPIVNYYHRIFQAKWLYRLISPSGD